MHDIRTGCIFDGPWWLSSWRNCRMERAYATTLFYDLKWFWWNNKFFFSYSLFKIYLIFFRFVYIYIYVYVYVLSPRSIEKCEKTDIYFETNIKLNFLKLFSILEISWISFFDSIPIAWKQGGTRDGASGRLDFIIRALLQIAAPAYRSRTGAFYYRLNPW